jgi:hypothetical protein
MKTKICLFISIITILSCEKKETLNNLTVITPVPLPIVVQGFNFPEDSLKIYQWINDDKFAPSKYDSVSVYKHAWGIWAGLTSSSKQSIDGDSLLVFETWLGVQDIQDAIKSGKKYSETLKKNRTDFNHPNQFFHARNFSNKNKLKSTGADLSFEEEISQWETVSYSPDASEFAINNQIYKQSVINKSFKQDAIGSIQDFPQKSITLKPVYILFHNDSKLKKLPVWLDAPNPPDSLTTSQFPYCVYIDVENKQPKGKKIIPTLQSNVNQSDIKNATVNLEEFISLKIDDKMAAYMKKEYKNSKAKSGEIAVLVAMHVSSKEVKNWTWQSFYWTPNKENPGSPSSLLAANIRPKELKGAAANYAANAAYVMTTPNNSPSGSPMFGYNPYLESGFGPSTFTVTKNSNPSYKYGMQTNCMNCHGLAIPSPKGYYTTAQYLDMKDKNYFGNEVQLDFAWSVQANIINDTIPYWKFKK